MPTTIFHFFSAAQYEQVVAETDRFLHFAPASATALHLKAQAHYQLGEYESCVGVLEKALVYLMGREPLETRLQLAALLANAQVELGRYDDALELVEHSVPRGATAMDPYGELLLAGAWAAYFQGAWEHAKELVRRCFESTGEDFTLARAALCAALIARQENGEDHRDKAYLVKAQNHLAHARNLFGNPEPVRRVYRIQIQLARRGASEEVGQLLHETRDLPSGSKIARILRETADLYMQHALGELDSAAVIAAVGRGVKRPWVALLPGAQVSVDCPETYGLQAVPPRSAEIQPPPMCIPAPAAVFAPRGPFVDPDPTAEFVLELERIPHLAAFPELDRIFGPDEPPHVALKPLPSPKPTPRALPRPKRAPPENVGAGVPAAPAPAPAPAEADPFAHEDDAREFSLPELRAEAEATPEDYSNVVVPADSESAEEDIPVLEVIEDAIPAGRPLSARRTPPPQGEEAPCVGSPGHADDEPAERDRSTTIRRREPAAGGRPAEKPDAAGSSSARPAHPARPVPSVRGDDDATLIRRKGGLSGTILLVESVDRVDRAFRQNLVDSPFRVATSVKSVDAALEEYLNLRPAVVVVDVLAYGASGANGIPSFVQRFLQVDPHCKIAVLTSAQTKALASESIRQGARMRIEIPLERCALLEALSRTAASRSGVEALRVPTLELKRPVACSWKALENGLSDMMGSWHPFVARVLDPMGLDANLDGDLQVGRAVRINIEIPGVAKPLHTLAEVVSCKEDRVFHHYTIRFSFLKLTSEAKDRLVNFLMEAISRARVQMQGLGRAVS